jgi:parvulin-like peptidyl-prolyl isomerase
MHTESKYKVGEITRTKEEAKKLIEEILQKLTSKKADFAELAVTYSDCSVSKLRGGFLGEVGYGKMFQSFEKAAFELEENEISAIVETGMGYHIITRISGKKVHARQIVLTHRESSAAVPEPSTRTKEEAKRLIEEILEKLKSKNADFAELARTYTESPIEKERGGDMGTFGLGWTPAPLEEAVFALKVNGIADIVETELGYHIIQRLPLDSE